SALDNFFDQTVCYLAKVYMMSGDSVCLRVERNFRGRLGVLAHQLAAKENMSYTEAVVSVLSRAEEFATSDLCCISAMSSRAASGIPVQWRVVKQGSAFFPRLPPTWVNVGNTQVDQGEEASQVKGWQKTKASGMLEERRKTTGRIHNE
ncbi:hypothetical protein FOL47_003613, partial [Perkinsus chesapeaki]